MKTTITTVATAIAKIASPVTIDLFYVEHANVLYSIKPKDYAVLAANPTAATLAKYFTQNILKHNPTNVFTTPKGRKSFEARRPMIYIENGVLVQQAMETEPAKTERTNSGGKTVRVVNNGPTTIYVRLGGSATRPYSIKADQLELLKTDPSALKYMGILKHLPTCVEVSLVQGLISTEAERPMYNMDEHGILSQVFAPGQAAKVEAVEVVKTEEIIESKQPETKKQRATRKQAEKSKPVAEIKLEMVEIDS